MVAEPAAESRLPRRRLTETGPDDIAHDALVNARWVDSGPSHGLANHERTQVSGGQRLEAAKELPVGVRTAATITASCMRRFYQSHPPVPPLAADWQQDQKT